MPGNLNLKIVAPEAELAYQPLALLALLLQPRLGELRAKLSVEGELAGLVELVDSTGFAEPLEQLGCHV